jgi:hypothetical protein
MKKTCYLLSKSFLYHSALLKTLNPSTPFMKPSQIRILLYFFALFSFASLLLSLNHAVMLPFWQSIGHVLDKILMLGMAFYLIYFTRKGSRYEKEWNEKNKK